MFKFTTPMKEIDQILLDLKRKIFKPVYFLSGEEPYYIDMISDYIENNALDEADREFNQTVVYGKDTELASILGLAKQFPMMSDYQVVIVKEAQNIKELKSKMEQEHSESFQELQKLKDKVVEEKLLRERIEE